MEKYYIFKNDTQNRWIYIAQADMDPPEPDVPYPPDPDIPRIPTYWEMATYIKRKESLISDSVKNAILDYQKEALGKIATRSKNLIRNIKAIYA